MNKLLHNYWYVCILHGEFIPRLFHYNENTEMFTSITGRDAGIVHYEEFQEIYNTCNKLNLDLCNMKDVPESDKMFEQFSKVQRMNALRSQLNRWTEDYNAKSKMFNRSIWKSSSLPYELNVNQFNCY